MRSKLLFRGIILFFLLFLNAKVAAQPTLSAPVNGSIWETTNPTLYWWYVTPTNVTYHVQLSTNPSDFTTPGVVLIDLSMVGAAAANYPIPPSTGLVVGTTYYWRVGVNGMYSAVWNFTPSTGNTSQNYALNVSIVGGGTVTKNPNLTSYPPGTVVELTAVPDPGWTFSGWSGDTTTTANPIDVTMNTSKNITATFVQGPPGYTLNVTVVGSGTVTKSPDLGSYTAGSVVTLTAIPDPGWTFAGWSVDTTTTANPIDMTMYTNKNVTATFDDSDSILVFPPDGSVDVPEDVQFQWNSCEGALSYRILVSEYPDFSVNTIDVTKLASNFDALYHNASGLLQNTFYYWKVIVEKPGGYIESAVWTFTTADQFVPRPFELISPQSPPNFVFEGLTFLWESAEDADEYHLVVYDITGTPTAVVDVVVLDTTYTTDFDPGRDYEWNVTALNAVGGTPSSNGVFFFTTAEIYYVATTGDDGTGDGSEQNPWETIMHALATAPPGSIIMVFSGQYDEDVIIGAPYILMGYGSTRPRVMRLSIVSSDVSVSNIIAHNPGPPPLTDNFGFYVPTGGPGLSNIVLDNIGVINTTTFDIGLFLVDIDGLSVTNADFSNNDKHGIVMYNCTNVTMATVVANENDEDGIVLHTCSNLDFTDVTANDNSQFPGAPGDYDGIQFFDVTNSTFNNLTAMHTDLIYMKPWSGLFIGGADSLTFNGGTFDSNFVGINIAPQSKLPTSAIPIRPGMTDATDITFNGVISSSFNVHGIVIQGDLYPGTPDTVSFVGNVLFDGTINLVDNVEGGITILGNVLDPQFYGINLVNTYPPYYGMGVFGTDPGSPLPVPGTYQPSGVIINNSSFEGYSLIDSSPAITVENLSSSYPVQPGTEGIASNDVDAQNNSFKDVTQYDDIEFLLIWDTEDYPQPNPLGDIIVDGSTADGLGPGAFALISPESPPGTISPYNVTFLWESSENADDYWLIVMEQSGPTVIDTIITDTTFVADLLAGKTYEWDVLAMNAIDSTTSWNGYYTFDTTPIFYVSTAGDDWGDGSEAHPWKTISQALFSVPPSSIIKVFGGQYNEGIFIDAPVTLIGHEFTRPRVCSLLIVSSGVSVSNFIITDECYEYEPEPRTKYSTTMNGEPRAAIRIDSSDSYELFNFSPDDGTLENISLDNVEVLNTSSFKIGLYAYKVIGLSVSNSVFSFNEWNGVYLAADTNATFTNVTANDNGETGIMVYRSTNLNFTNVTANDNSWDGDDEFDGIQLFDVTHSVFTDIYASDTDSTGGKTRQRFGLYIDGSDDLTF
ncbi:right-handed parallel beta-helix repeat-containing protein, partial [Bacteroidota bacterium]